MQISTRSGGALKHNSDIRALHHLYGIISVHTNYLKDSCRNEGISITAPGFKA